MNFYPEEIEGEARERVSRRRGQVGREGGREGGRNQREIEILSV